MENRNWSWSPVPRRSARRRSASSWPTASTARSSTPIPATSTGAGHRRRQTDHRRAARRPPSPDRHPRPDDEMSLARYQELAMRRDRRRPRARPPAAARRRHPALRQRRRRRVANPARAAASGHPRPAGGGARPSSACRHLAERLARVDPVAAERSGRNLRRIIRALEIHEVDRQADVRAGGQGAAPLPAPWRSGLTHAADAAPPGDRPTGSTIRSRRAWSTRSARLLDAGVAAGRAGDDAPRLPPARRRYLHGDAHARRGHRAHQGRYPPLRPPPGDLAARATSA